MYKNVNFEERIAERPSSLFHENHAKTHLGISGYQKASLISTITMAAKKHRLYLR
jgi:hypothetical protein